MDAAACGLVGAGGTCCGAPFCPFPVVAPEPDGVGGTTTAPAPLFAGAVVDPLGEPFVGLPWPLAGPEDGAAGGCAGAGAPRVSLVVTRVVAPLADTVAVV